MLATIEEKLKSIFDCIEPLPADVSENFSLQDLALDEVYLEELQYELETEFNIEISDIKKLSKCTFGQLVKYIQEKL